MIYRREIDGLRALAIVPVILFHAGFSAFQGGFVGVDVFFVISGYLIATIIMDELDAGKFSVLRFYERRARRILPALFFVMAVCLPFAWWWLLPSDLKAFSDSLVAVSAFSSNLLFWQQSGYFDTASELKPLLHTWSLAVEEQFYLCFPLLLIVTQRRARRWQLPLLLAIFVASFVYAKFGLAADESAAFFLLPARCWELLLGVFVASYLRSANVKTLPKLVAECGAALGMAMVLLASFSFDKHTASSGLHALVPTLGTVLIIICASQHTLTGKLLGLRPLVGIGLISYGAYLWHQPLLAFARHRSMAELDAFQSGALALLAFGLAYLTWKFIETPFRNAGAGKGRRIVLLAVAGCLLFAAIGLVGHVNNGFESRLAQRIDHYDVWKQQFQKNTGRKHCDDGGNPDLWAIKFCKLGDLTADPVPSIAVFGDSHTLAINPYIDSLAKKMGRSYIHIALPGCAPLLGVDVSMKYQVGLCPQLARRQLAFVKTHQIKRVLLAARWSLYTDGEYEGPKPTYRLTAADRSDPGESDPHGAFAPGLAATLQAYRALGVDVFVLMQVPQQKVVPEKVYTDIAYMMFLKETQAADAMSRQASIDVPSHRKLQAYNRSVIERLARENGATVLNPDAYFCTGERCLIGDARNSYYRDANHLNSGGASRMEPLLRSVFE